MVDFGYLFIFIAVAITVGAIIYTYLSKDRYW
jgi:hypothetical protein